MKGKLFIVSAPSGGGKTSIVTEALKRLQPAYILKRVIGYTSRQPRTGEVPGHDYHFVSVEEFREKEQNGFFIETTEYAGKRYGTPASIIDELTAGTSLIATPDRPGAKNLLKAVNPAVLIWIMPPNIDVLRTRLLNRADLSDAQYDTRIAIAREELHEEEKQRLFQYHLVNEAFDRTIAEFMMIIENELAS